MAALRVAISILIASIFISSELKNKSTLNRKKTYFCASFRIIYYG